MLPYPLKPRRLSRAKRLYCQICCTTLDRTDRVAHLLRHIEERCYFGVEPMADIFAPAEHRSMKGV
jgi:hypothetical protein